MADNNPIPSYEATQQLSKTIWLRELSQTVQKAGKTLPEGFSIFERLAFKAAFDQLADMCNEANTEASPAKKHKIATYSLPDDSRDKNDGSWPK
jgi:cation transport regulator ChaB